MDLGRHELHIYVHCPHHIPELLPCGVEGGGEPLATAGLTPVGPRLLLSVHIHDASQNDLHHYIEPLYM